MSRRLRNRLAHALNGNGRGGSQRDDWQQVGGRLDGRQLMEPQPAGRLRAMGWTLPASTPDDYILRVHDTRLDPTWLRELGAELAPIDTDTVVVGGDFVSSPDIEDIPAFKPAPLQRWGPPTGDKYHILVPPRPHVANWLQRCHHQLGVEAPLTKISVCCIVPRASCPHTLDAASLQRLVPQSAPLLSDPTVELRVIAVGERPPVVRIPAEEMTLPPRKWEVGNLPRHQILLVLQFHRHGGSHSPLAAEWIRGQLPIPAPSELELLRLQLVLPPPVSKMRPQSAWPAKP